jgi:uncharacterized membrane protein (DUF106 family)
LKFDLSKPDEETSEGGEEGAKTTAPERPPPPPFKLSTFLLVFLFFMGIWMLIDQSARNEVAWGIGALIYPIFGFSGHFPLLTMLLVGLLQMSFSAVAYNYTTDWVESAKVQMHSKAIRPLQMAAVRSGKKQHMEALRPHLNELSTRQSKMMIGQLKGMAVTWFLLIAMYTYVGLFLANQAVSPTVNMYGASVDLMMQVGPFPLWFLVFSLYTIPFNLLLRRLLKHQTLSSKLNSGSLAVPEGAS